MRYHFCAIILGLGCGNYQARTVAPADPDETTNTQFIPIENAKTTVDLATWNLEWFGDPGKGPSDDALQLTNVAEVLGGLALDVVGVEEVVSETQFHALLAQLPGYHGLLASEVAGGAHHYRTGEQKVGVILAERFRVDNARLILTGSSYAFAGRPPLELTLSFEEDGQTRTLVVIVVHLKSGSDYSSYQRRVHAAQALYDYVDTSGWTAVIGDFNDDLSHSITSGEPSPFAALNDVEHPFVTQEISNAHVSTTVSHKSTIDHHWVTGVLQKHYVAGSTRVMEDQAPDFGTTTSDHYPVVSSFDLR